MMKPEREKDTEFEEPLMGSGPERDEALEADLEGGGEGMSNDIEGLRSQLEAAARAAAESEDRYLRERAELENYKKRSQRERAEAIRYAAEPLARDLIAVVDNLERALEHARASDHANPVIAGVELVLKGALETLQRHGVERIEAAGEVFDPSRHEAIAKVADENVEANRVVQQFLPGYRLHDRLLRAAQVSVSSGSGSGRN